MKKILTLLTALTMALLCLVPAAAAENAAFSEFKATSKDKAVSLSWEGNSSSFDVFWKRSSSETWKKAGTVKKNTVKISGLKNGVSYDFKIVSGKSETPVATVSPSSGASKTVVALEKDSFETATESVKNMRVGYNIGNTFDATGTWLDPDAPVAKFEQAWGNPQITKKFIDCIAEQGIGAVRLPVSWGLNSDSDGNIRKEWLDRVQEVVDWILEDGMYCIVNIHHDTGTEGWIKASDSSFNNSSKRFANIWNQVATRFKDYGEELVFECFNETINDSNDWGSKNTHDYEIIRNYEQLFVDTVRKSGGRNDERNIICSTYAASGDSTILNGFKFPIDTVKDHMILEVHCYDPQGFTWADATWTKLRDTWGTAQDKTDIDNYMDRLAKKAESLGAPAIIGEFGSVDKNNDDERAKHTEYFVSAAKKRGITCFYWDDGGSFRIINRSGKVEREKIVKALVNGAKE